ncbi:MAG: hypothetical protein IKI97_12665 [Clostridia bacterium]|nr:hypothetical protein [Clostridia bacterium]
MPEDINKLWEFACSGNTEKLKEYYENGGSINNRYFRFGESHSLIMGAFRNSHYDTVEYLMSVGEGLTNKEYDEIKANLRQQDIMHQLVDRQELLLDLKANM